METKFTVDYFIKKFEAIPEEKWCGDGCLHKYLDDKHCAYGHCENATTKEGQALTELFKNKLIITTVEYGDVSDAPVAYINDGQALQYQQFTPKARILASLYDIKKLQAKEQPAPTPEPEYRFIEKHESIKPLLEKVIQLS